MVFMKQEQQEFYRIINFTVFIKNAVICSIYHACPEKMIIIKKQMAAIIIYFNYFLCYWRSSLVQKQYKGG